MSYCSRRCNSLVLPFVTNQCLSCKRSELAFHPTRHKWNPRENLPREFQRVQRLRGNRKPLFWLVKHFHLDLCIALNARPRESSKPTVARAAHSCQLQIHSVPSDANISYTDFSGVVFCVSSGAHPCAAIEKSSCSSILSVPISPHHKSPSKRLHRRRCSMIR